MSDLHRKTIVVLLQAYLVATLVAVVFGVAMPGSVLTRATVSVLVGAVVVFGFSWRHDTTSVFDPYWSIAPPLLAVALWGQTQGVRATMVMVLVWAWGARLTWNWWRGYAGLPHEDWRYIDFRRMFGRWYWLVSLAALHLFPAAIVALLDASLIAAMQGPRPMGWGDVAALLLASSGLWFEATADRELRRFVRERASVHALLDKGLWSWCRHPNYWGEICFWSGIAGLGVGATRQWWPLIGPLALVLMVRTLSIPMMEARHRQRKFRYDEYVRRTPRLVPFGWLSISRPGH